MERASNFAILVIIFLANHLSYAATKPTIINGTVTLADSAQNEQMLYSSIRIGSVPVINGQPDVSRFRHECSGTITGKSQVATAAHCFRGPASTWIDFVEVRTSINPDKRKFVRVASVKTAKSIDDIIDETANSPKKRGLDLAMLTLDEEVDDKNITPLCDASKIKVNSEYIVAGFGTTEDQKPSSQLRHTKVKMQQVNEGTFFSKPVRDQDNNSAACYRDSGGGLFVNDPAKKQVCLAGAVSGNDQPQAKGDPVELCLRPNLRQVFARATPEAVKNLKVEQVFDANPSVPPSEGSPGSQGTLPPGNEDEDLHQTPIQN